MSSCTSKTSGQSRKTQEEKSKESSSKPGSGSSSMTHFDSVTSNGRTCRSPKTKQGKLSNGFTRTGSSASGRPLASLKTNRGDDTHDCDSDFSRTSSNASNKSRPTLSVLDKDSSSESLYAPGNANVWCFDAIADKDSDRLGLHKMKFFYKGPKQMEKKADPRSLRNLRIGLRTQLLVNIKLRHYHALSRDAGHGLGRKVGVCELICRTAFV